MEISSFQSYLIILFVVLIIISIFVFRQFLKTRREELNLVKFEQKGLDSLTQATELYAVSYTHLTLPTILRV